ncbi:hypothetical protein Acsp04_23180 [Actinomadura sp. NBRC 104425]|nr:hypothetical protein Acsp04_23180 [Actinomadura sp. NBRC 104425]
MWLGHDEALDAQVAIKVLSGSLIDDLDVRNRFLEEARILRRADSERLVRVHDIGELPDGRPYFVMSYADRGTLADRMRDRPLPVNEALAYAEEIAYGVEVINSLGVIHRDLKPSNVLFQSTRNGRERLLIADLGLAKALAHASGAFTLPVGTPGYMSPEQARFGGGLDVRADVYGLGALTYHMIAGRPPGPPPVKKRPSELREGVPPAFDEVILRALEVERDKRYPTAEAFAEALSTLRPTGSPSAQEHGASDGGGAAPAPPPSSTPPSSTPPPSSTAPPSTAQPSAASTPPPPTEATSTAVDEPLSEFDAERTVRDKPQHLQPPPPQPQPPRPHGQSPQLQGQPPQPHQSPPPPLYPQSPAPGAPADDDSTRQDWPGGGDQGAVTVVDHPSSRGSVPFGPPATPPNAPGPAGPASPSAPRADNPTAALPTPPQHGRPPEPVQQPGDRTAVLPPAPHGAPQYQGGQPPPPTGFQPAPQNQEGQAGGAGQGLLARLKDIALPGRSKQQGGGAGSPSRKVPLPLVIGAGLLCVALVVGLTLGTVLSGDEEKQPAKPRVPQDFTQVADPSGKIRAAVPKAWPLDRQEPTWVPTTVGLNDAQPRPVLRATPNVTQFKGDGPAPGVFIGLTKDVAQGKLPPPGVTRHRACTPAGTEHYTSPDKALTGTITRFTGCQAGTPSVTEVGLRDSRGTFGVWIRIKENDNRNLTKTILDNLKLTAP